LHPGEAVAKNRFGVAAMDGEKDRLIVLIAVFVEHQQDFPHAGQHLIGHQILHVMGIGQRHIGRRQRLGNTAGCIHTIQRQSARHVRDEIETITDNLGSDKEAGGE
jgi:hypothetical protein